MQNENNNEYQGYGLFNDIEDAKLRTRNRAVILANITENNIKNGRVNDRGRDLLSGYFGLVPSEERADVFVEYLSHCDRLGIDTSVVYEAAR
jgi:hypothetical protein